MSGRCGTNDQELFQTLQTLVRGKLLGMFSGVILLQPMTDGWVDLMTALQDVRAFAGEQITLAELKSVGECIRGIDRVVHRWLEGEPDQRTEILSRRRSDRGDSVVGK